MNRTAFRVWLSICWILTVGIAYMVGWYKGARSVATVAVQTAHASFTYILIGMGVIAVIAAVAALKARGMIAGRGTHASV